MQMRGAPNSFSSWDEIKHGRCLLKKALEGTNISALFSVYRITSSAYVPRLLVFRDYGAGVGNYAPIVKSQ